MEPILYSPLRRSESRLIHLHPGQWSDPISLTLQPFSLQPPELPFFEAVSYTWDDPMITTPVTCSGMTIQVMKSVENLLRRFRLAADTRLLWVDAMCINQEDLQERNDQVRAMDIIYQRASRVLIYLGEADDYSDSAMDAIAERKPSTSSIQKMVLDFFEHRKWFSRVWVLQEVALADCALAICGSKCVLWANFPAWWAQNIVYLQDRILLLY
ncbi:heterokaryon incompatibility protein-domain-containing protein [Pyrenochaeta sp. MPI-SDFR-AT-0127]|nr:heterokaryon incompatibility protein-domain-containing protein [Pyrenochaeta sp. MPI-SDFR-AT-0127]